MLKLTLNRTTKENGEKAMMENHLAESMEEPTRHKSLDVPLLAGFFAYPGIAWRGYEI